jgi:hypothetical protein
MLNSHSKIHHKGRSLLPAEEHIRTLQLLSEAGYRDSSAEKYSQLPGQKPVDGLEVLNGYLCPAMKEDGIPCSTSFLGRATFIRHISEHNLQPKPNPSACASYVQTLFRQGGSQRYFSVDPSLSNLDPSSASAYAHVLRTLESLPEAQIPASHNDKDRASIHWFTRWPELLKNYTADKESVDLLRSLVSFPEPGSDPKLRWLLKLWDHGCRWWDDAEAAHVNCSHRASTMLKSHQR